MYLVKVQLELYILHPKGNEILSSVATNQRAGLRPTLVLVLSVCVRCSKISSSISSHSERVCVLVS